MAMKRIAVLTSGGDAPGMNPAIRAVVRMGMALGLEVYGVERGYQGLMDNSIHQLQMREIGGILGRGGTILESARALEFQNEIGRRKAIHNLNRASIDGLIIIGGNGTHKGAHALSQMGFPLVTIPSTIDNDLCFTDITLGVDTAINTALDAIDKIRDTASSHRRAFLIETMGRDSGYLALMCGIAGGAEIVLIPEAPMSPPQVLEAIKEQYMLGKAHSIIVVAEGYKPGTQAVYDYLHEREAESGFSTRMTILGHIQRGGSPTAYERVLATRLAIASVEALTSGHTGVMVGLVGNKIQTTDLAQVVACHKGVDLQLYKTANILEFGKSASKFDLGIVNEPPATHRNGFGTIKITEPAPEEMS
jgi:6-phosphofructokinase 1